MSKGIADKEIFWVLLIVFMAVALIAGYLLVGTNVFNIVKTNINSEVKNCEVFEKSPIFGTIECRKTS